MPCWSCEARVATLSNTWFLCDHCREFGHGDQLHADHAAARAASEVPEPQERAQSVGAGASLLPDVDPRVAL
jgi:hypothetical protein